MTAPNPTSLWTITTNTDQKRGDYFKAYILKNGWSKISERLDNNQIQYKKFDNDTIILSEYMRIENYKTRKNAYEGHYLHYDTEFV